MKALMGFLMVQRQMTLKDVRFLENFVGHVTPSLLIVLIYLQLVYISCTVAAVFSELHDHLASPCRVPPVTALPSILPTDRHCARYNCFPLYLLYFVMTIAYHTACSKFYQLIMNNHSLFVMWFAAGQRLVSTRQPQGSSTEL